MKRVLTFLVLIMIFISCNEENELQLNSEQINFYNWDMTGNKTMIIQSPIDSKQIHNYYAVIYKDFDLFSFEMFCLSSDEYSFLSIDGNQFVIDITEGGFFDSERFDNNDQIRGHIIIEYY